MMRLGSLAPTTPQFTATLFLREVRRDRSGWEGANRGCDPTARSCSIIQKSSHPCGSFFGPRRGPSEFFARHVKDFQSGQSGQSVEELQDEVVGGEEDPVMSMWALLHWLRPMGFRGFGSPPPFQSLFGGSCEPSDLGSLTAGMFSTTSSRASR